MPSSCQCEVLPAGQPLWAGPACPAAGIHWPRGPGLTVQPAGSSSGPGGQCLGGGGLIGSSCGWIPFHPPLSRESSEDPAQQGSTRGRAGKGRGDRNARPAAADTGRAGCEQGRPQRTALSRRDSVSWLLTSAVTRWEAVSCVERSVRAGDTCQAGFPQLPLCHGPQEEPGQTREASAFFCQRRRFQGDVSVPAGWLGSVCRPVGLGVCGPLTPLPDRSTGLAFCGAPAVGLGWGDGTWAPWGCAHVGLYTHDARV